MPARTPWITGQRLGPQTDWLKPRTKPPGQTDKPLAFPASDRHRLNSGNAAATRF
jgi:hypothetical protein